jgi:hypothetical protein
MKPSVQKIINKLPKEKVDLEKVELAKKPSVILKDIEKLDNQIRKEEQKIERAFLQYKKVYNEWSAFTQSVEGDFIDLANDFGQIVRELNRLGIDPKTVGELVKADPLLGRLRTLVLNIKNLYSEPK